MTIQQAIEKTSRYIGGESQLPILVDLPTPELLSDFRLHFDVGHHKIIEASHYCRRDNLPMMDQLKYDLANISDIMFLFGLEPFLCLQGRKAVINELKSLIQLTCTGKLIIVTMGCSNFLAKFDSRLFDAGRIHIVDGSPIVLPTLNFVSPELKDYLIQSVNGIDGLSKMAFLLESGIDSISIVTTKKHTDFPNSMYDIEERDSALQVVSGYHQELSALNEVAGTQSQWIKLLQEVEDTDCFSDYIAKKFGNVSNLSLTIERFSNLNTFDKWLLFISLKIFGAKDNDYLSIVISKSETFDDFIANSFSEILTHSPKDRDFDKLYNQRRKVISQLSNYVDELSVFCKQVYGKTLDALYYLTDLSTKEKELTIELLCEYKPSLEDMLPIIRKTYPDLALYLSPFDMGNEYLNKYFSLYKYCKVTNQILPELREMVDEQAQQRCYNEWLAPRSVIVDNIKEKRPKDILYFMDAMGVEFLGFLQEKCFEENLLIYANVARCELPSITSLNKDFVTEFKNCDCTVKDNKELDDLKHEGQNSYNYENTKLPIHIVEEINILNRLVAELKLINSDQTAYVIADHGASRLAVINENENKWEVSEKGQHSGRCCPKSDISEKPDFATEENDFWCLANYDRFKGGRKANVEVHGGATLEEVAVPVISVVKAKKKIDCKVADDKPILVSFKRTAKLLLFVSVESGDVTISVNGKTYKAVQTDVHYHYQVEMPDVKTAKTYHFNVYLNGSLIGRDLHFEIKKEGANERKLF